MSDATFQHPEWVRPGLQVIVVGSMGYIGPPSISLGTVARLTRTQAVLTDGSRFRLNEGDYREVGDYRGRIVPLDHPYSHRLPEQPAGEA